MGVLMAHLNSLHGRQVKDISRYARSEVIVSDTLNLSKGSTNSRLWVWATSTRRTIVRRKTR